MTRFHPGSKIVKLHGALRGVIAADASAAPCFKSAFEALLQLKTLPVDCKMELLSMLPLFASLPPEEFEGLLALAESKIVVQYSPLGLMARRRGFYRGI